MRVPMGRHGLLLRGGDSDGTCFPERRLSKAVRRRNSTSSLAWTLSFVLACILAARGLRLVIEPNFPNEGGGWRVREERFVDILGVVAGKFLLALERAVVIVLRFSGAGVSDLSPERIVGCLCFCLVVARLRFGLRGSLKMSRWIQRRSAITVILNPHHHNSNLFNLKQQSKENQN